MKPTGDSLRHADVKAKNDALAQKLGVRRIAVDHETGLECEIPIDFTTDTGHALLEKTLLERGYDVWFDSVPQGARVTIFHKGRSEQGYDPDHRIALVLAAHKLLVEK